MPDNRADTILAAAILQATKEGRLEVVCASFSAANHLRSRLYNFRKRLRLGQISKTIATTELEVAAERFAISLPAGSSTLILGTEDEVGGLSTLARLVLPALEAEGVRVKEMEEELNHRFAPTLLSEESPSKDFSEKSRKLPYDLE